MLVHAGRKHGLRFYFMGAREGFETHRLAAFVLQRMGVFSVDREGADISAIKTAIRLLQECRYPLVIFPEGEIFHHHERLDELNEGVATIRLRSLARLPEGQRAYIVPAALRYTYDDRVEETFCERLGLLEERITWKRRPEREIVERIYRFGGALLAIKEEEFLGRAQNGSLVDRIAGLQEQLVAMIEERYRQRPSGGEIPRRVKALRGRIRKALRDGDGALDPKSVDRLYDDLDTLFVAVQLYSYPGQYLSESPTVNRIAETIFKLEEDLSGARNYLADRDVAVRFDEPINVADFLEEHSNIMFMAQILLIYQGVSLY